MFTNTKESGLEMLIVKWLVEHNGYEEGSNADYNKEYAIDETRLFRFLQDTQPEQMDKLGVFKFEQKKRQFLNRLQGEIAKRGIIDVLRNGIKVYPVDMPGTIKPKQWGSHHVLSNADREKCQGTGDV